MLVFLWHDQTWQRKSAFHTGKLSTRRYPSYPIRVNCAVGRLDAQELQRKGLLHQWQPDMFVNLGLVVAIFCIGQW